MNTLTETHVQILTAVEQQEFRRGIHAELHLCGVFDEHGMDEQPLSNDLLRLKSQPMIGSPISLPKLNHLE